MAERVLTGYKRLFEVRVLHHYFLDEGISDFTALDEATRMRRLLSGYDVRQFLSFAPAAPTERLLRGLGCLYKTTGLGFVVAVPRGVKIPADAQFGFVATLQSADFMNYTALTIRKQKISEIGDGGTMRRYKENVFVFSNNTGVKRTIGGEPWCCLSREIPTLDGSAPYPAEAFATDGTALFQAIRDTAAGMPPADRHTVAANLNTYPVFVHQGDVPALTLPDGSSFRGIELTDGLPDDIFAMIRIDASTANAGFEITDANNLPLQDHPVFEIHFKNRATFWRYYNKTTGSFDDEPWPATPLPLTFNGNPTPVTPHRKKGTPASLTIKMDPTGLLIDQLYSDIIE